MIEPTRIPLGASDPQGRVGAVNRNDTDIDLIDLMSGQVVRRWPGLGRPLMILRDRLIGWRVQAEPHGLRLFSAGLSAQEADQRWSQVVDLPQWADFGAHDPGLFTHKIGVEEDRIVLFIKARHEPLRGGPPPSQEEVEAAQQSFRRRMEFDLLSLELRQERDEDGFMREQEDARRGEHLARDAQGFVYRRDGVLRNAPWQSGEGERFLQSHDAPGAAEQTLSLARPSEAGPEAIAGIPAQQLDTTVPELSLDGRHLAVADHDGATPVWRIYSAGDGDAVFSLPFLEGLRSFRIFDHRLVLLQEKNIGSDLSAIIESALICFDIATGSSIWRYLPDVTETESRYHLPPVP